MKLPSLEYLPSPPEGKSGWPWTEESELFPEKMPDGRSWPKISIVTPSYDQGEFLEETIRSVLLQNYPNLEYISKNPDCKIFIATDQKQFIDIIKFKYQQRVISYDAIRSTSLRNTFQKQDGNCYTKGEDVLIDCLLLSKCDFLLKCTSAVGEYALYFNPQLRCIDLNHTQDNLSFAARTSVFLRLAKLRLFFKLIALYNLIFNRKKL